MNGAAEMLEAGGLDKEMKELAEIEYEENKENLCCRRG